MPPALTPTGERRAVPADGGLLPARSISRSACSLLRAGPFAARVLAVFEQACDLVTADGRVIALVLRPVGDGPHNVVVDASPGDLASIEPGTPAWLEHSRLRVGGLTVALDSAVIWEPRPDWDFLRAQRRAIAGRLPLLRTLALQDAPEGSFLALFDQDARPVSAGRRTFRSVRAPLGQGVARKRPDRSADSLRPAALAVAREGAQALRAGWRADWGQLRRAASQLAGLGGGLTPAGDDFLAGVMLWGWLAHPRPHRLCRIIVEEAAPRTTTLSAAFLRSAGQGECSAPWHRLLAALQSDGASPLAPALREVLAHGHTSGADTLAGFLWIFSTSRQAPLVSPKRSFPPTGATR